MQAILFVIVFILLLGIQSFGGLKIALEDRLFVAWEKKEEELRFRVRLAFAESELERYKADHPIDRESRPKKPKGLEKPKIKKEKAKQSRSLNFDETRPPESSRLNLWECIHEKKEPYYESAARLMRMLYGKNEFFMQRAGFEYQILDELAAKKEEIASFSSVDDLATVVLKDMSLQETFYKILRGGADYPSLLWYVRLDQKHEALNVLFVPIEVFHALFGKVDLTLDFEAYRTKLLERMRDEEEHRSLIEADLCLNRTAIHQQLKEECEALFMKYKISDEVKLDYHLGKPGSILYLVDDLTGARVRERLATKRA